MEQQWQATEESQKNEALRAVGAPAVYDLRNVGGKNFVTPIREQNSCGSRITALWSINQNRNSYVGVSGIGWKKLANNSDSAIVALTMLSSHAREKGSAVNYHEESDGMIHQMYVW